MKRKTGRCSKHTRSRSFAAEMKKRLGGMELACETRGFLRGDGGDGNRQGEVELDLRFSWNDGSFAAAGSCGKRSHAGADSCAAANIGQLGLARGVRLIAGDDCARERSILHAADGVDGGLSPFAGAIDLDSVGVKRIADTFELKRSELDFEVRIALEAASLARVNDDSTKGRAARKVMDDNILVQHEDERRPFPSVLRADGRGGEDPQRRVLENDDGRGGRSDLRRRQSSFRLVLVLGADNTRRENKQRQDQEGMGPHGISFLVRKKDNRGGGSPICSTLS